MSTLLAYVVARMILLAVAVVFNLPLLFLMLALRRRLPRQVCLERRLDGCISVLV